MDAVAPAWREGLAGQVPAEWRTGSQGWMWPPDGFAPAHAHQGTDPFMGPHHVSFTLQPPPGTLTGARTRRVNAGGHRRPVLVPCPHPRGQSLGTVHPARRNQMAAVLTCREGVRTAVQATCTQSPRFLLRVRIPAPGRLFTV